MAHGLKSPLLPLWHTPQPSPSPSSSPHWATTALPTRAHENSLLSSLSTMGRPTHATQPRCATALRLSLLLLVNGPLPSALSSPARQRQHYGQVAMITNPLCGTTYVYLYRHHPPSMRTHAWGPPPLCLGHRSHRPTEPPPWTRSALAHSPPARRQMRAHYAPSP